MAPKNKKAAKKEPDKKPGKPVEWQPADEAPMLSNGPGSGTAPIFPDKIHPADTNDDAMKDDTREKKDEKAGPNVDYTDLFMV